MLTHSKNNMLKTGYQKNVPVSVCPVETSLRSANREKLPSGKPPPTKMWHKPRQIDQVLHKNMNCVHYCEFNPPMLF